MPHTALAGAPAELAALQTQLQALRSGQTLSTDFSRHARAHTALLAALPPRYGQVLHDLLDRLESSALFAEESCSFSQRELHDSLQLWLDKAAQQLPA